MNILREFKTLSKRFPEICFLSILMISCVVTFQSEVEIDASTIIDRESGTDHQLPQIITGTVNVTTYTGDTATLPCDVANLGNHHVNWLKIDTDTHTPITLTVGYHQFSRNMRFRVARVNHHHNTHHHHLKQQQYKQSIDEPEAVAVPLVSSDTAQQTPAPLPPPPSPKIESWNFEIRKVSPDDQGLYECYIKINNRHKTKAHIYLVVKSEKEKISDSKSGSFPYYSNSYLYDNPRSERLASNSIERIDLPPNNWVKLRCNATGAVPLSSSRNLNQPSYDLQWYKDDNLIEQDSRRLKKWVSSYDDSNYMELDLYAVDPEDSGLYQCRRDKTILKNVFLHVLGNQGSIINTSNHLIAFLIMLGINLVLFANT